MIARGFKSVIWVGAVGAAAIACYMVSLQVATERADLAKVEAQIVAAKRDIRTLQTELGTRGRMSQLEQWNADVLALSAPTAAQYLPDQMMLARFDSTEPSLDERAANVRTASVDTGAQTPAAAAPTPQVVQAVAQPAPQPHAQPMVRQASFTTAAAEAPAKPLAEKKAAAKPEVQQAKAEPKKPEAKKQETAKAEVKKPTAATPAAAKKADTKTTAAKLPAEKPRVSKIDTKLAAELKSGAGRKPQGSGGN
ncbi:MAG TPA: hypothetical protein VIA98_09775 [Allosphingosinicella sp.]|jgi:hypothetical protein